MLAIASLATGFVVAAVTPSHGLDAGETLGKADALSKLDVEGTLGKISKTVAGDSLAVDEDALGGMAGRQGQEGKGGKEG
ncbi:hypothetical protein WBG99_32715 [Streptomyces sp. TG1A-60]|uniref:hypothetical protein n=1 Tax=Streptomyces sp. TG1A-60 TaxID=3129111 RepID=UPI0030CD7B21